MRNIFILGLVSFFADVSTEMVYPLIPAFLIWTLGASPVLLGVIEGIAESVGSLLKVFFGYFSDKLKKRKLFAGLGYGTSALGKIILSLATGWFMVLASRFIDRFGKAIRTAPRDALIVESSNEGRRGAAFGLHRTIDTAGAIVGILIAYFILLNYAGAIRTVFYWAILPAIISVLVLIFFVKDSRQKILTEKKADNKISFSWSVLPRQLKIFFLITFIFSLGNSSNLFLILKALNIGFIPIFALLLYLTYNISYFLFLYPASKLSDKIGRRILLVVGYFIYGLVYLAFAFVGVKVFYWFLFVVYGAYIGLTEGVEKALVADHSPVDLKATTLGIYATIIGITLLPASIIAGFLWQYFGASTPFYFSALTGFTSSILALKYIK